MTQQQSQDAEQPQKFEVKTAPATRRRRRTKTSPDTENVKTEVAKPTTKSKSTSSSSVSKSRKKSSSTKSDNGKSQDSKPKQSKQRQRKTKEEVKPVVEATIIKSTEPAPRLVIEDSIPKEGPITETLEGDLDEQVVRFDIQTGKLFTEDDSEKENAVSIHSMSDEQKAIMIEELDDLASRRVVDLTRLAKIAGITDFYDLTRNELMVQVANARIQGSSSSIPLSNIIDGGGVVEVLNEGYGFLRSAKHNYLPSNKDVYVSPAQIKRFGLKTGDTIYGDVRAPKEQEKFHALVKIDTINYIDPDENKKRHHFDSLTPLFPDERLSLETHRSGYAMRIVDMLAPIGKGQRGLIVSPPKSGKTILLKDIANSIAKNHPEVKLIVLLVDERPEEVTDMERSVHGDVIASTFDEPPDRHVQVAEMVLEKSKRMVEAGHDVVVLLDSITRLARAHNTVVPHSGKILSGGVDANALHKPKRFFGAARNIEDGGSLTIIATALVETGSRMDEVIFEEFKGTGNMELVLDRKLSERRIFPAIDVKRSSTRREDLLYTPEENGRIWVLRKILSEFSSINAMEFLLDRIKNSPTNLEFFQTMNS